jgi:hypothetical protein
MELAMKMIFTAGSCHKSAVKIGLVFIVGSKLQTDGENRP